MSGGPDRLEAVADDLMAKFERWAADHRVDVEWFVVDAVLDWRLQEGGDPAQWEPGDVRRLLTEWFPRKVTVDRGEWPSVLSTLHRWIDFLAAAPTGQPTDQAALHAAVEQNADAFAAAMADETNYGMAKFWMTRMIDHGVDLEDDEGVRRFLAAAQAGEIGYNQDVLAEIMRRQAFDAELGLVEPGLYEQGPLPPVVVLPASELEALARDSALITRFKVLTTWVGTGRVLTATKRLRVADARELARMLDADRPYLERARSSADLPEVSLLIAWAKAARLVRVVKGRLVPVKSAAGILDRPLDLWRRAHEVFPELGHAICMPTSHYEGPSLLGEALPEVLPELWLCLYTAGGTSVPVELLVQVVRDALHARFDFGAGGMLVDFRELMWRRDLGHMIEALQTLDAVKLSEDLSDAELDKIIELSGNSDPELALVGLTPLGLWGVREQLLAEGCVAPVVSELTGLPWEQVCGAVRHASPDVTESAVTEWVTARPAAEAAAELAEFCATGPSPSDRLLTWTALEHTGALGVGHARRLRSAGGVVGAVATEWLVRHDALAQDAAHEHEMILALAENLAAMHEHDLLIDELTRHPIDDQTSFVDALAGTDHPDRFDLLTTIAERHPDGEVAAAARTALGRQGV
jgi:hypothetical protein